MGLKKLKDNEKILVSRSEEKTIKKQVLAWKKMAIDVTFASLNIGDGREAGNREGVQQARKARIETSENTSSRNLTIFIPFFVNGCFSDEENKSLV